MLNDGLSNAKLASECGISNGSVYTRILDYLGISKLSAR